MGETALNVSRRRLEPLPKVRSCCVLMCSLGRRGRFTLRDSWERSAGWRWGNMVREVVMAEEGSWDGANDCDMECDIVESIMRRRSLGE